MADRPVTMDEHVKVIHQRDDARARVREAVTLLRTAVIAFESDTGDGTLRDAIDAARKWLEVSDV